MELVRINLVARDSRGQERMLRMATEIMEDPSQVDRILQSWLLYQSTLQTNKQ